MTTVLAIADDTTGALEIGALLAKDGVPSLVSLEPALAGEEPPALVVDAQTRLLPPSEAYRRVADLAAGAARRRLPFLYKKTDSTLRGNIAVEFQALLDVFPALPLVYVPAYPALGRTVVEGCLLVDGRPLAETAFARDPLHPANASSIPELLSAGCAAPIRLIRAAAELSRSLAAGEIFVCDAESEADVADVATTLEGRTYLAAGPGGFARVWIPSLSLPRASPLPAPVSRRPLVICGSSHPASREQVRRFGEDASVLAAPERRGQSPGWVVRQLAAAAVSRLDKEPDHDGLVIFGGDTAWHVLGALGVTTVDPRGELLPGIPVSVIQVKGKRWPLVTKAGGFGPPEVLAQIRERLHRGL